MREVGDGADKRAQAISGERRRGGRGGGCSPELGGPKRKRERGEEKVGERAGGGSWARRPKMRKVGGGKRIYFSFSKSVF